MKVKQVMLSQNQFPVVLEKTILKEALEEMDKYGLGIYMCRLSRCRKFV